MPRFLEMLRAKNIFGNSNRRPLGMPDADDSTVASMMNQAMARANSMKNDDMQRQREMMVFENTLRRQNQPPASPIQSRIPPKKNVVFGGVHPPTTMQRQFREDDLDKTDQKNRMALQTGSLNNALATGRQRDDADMARTVAEINGRSQVAHMNKEMAAKAADDARTDKAKTDEIARTQKGPIINTPDPRDPTKMIATRHNPITNKLERVQVDEDQAGTAYKPGNIPKPTVNPGQDPVKLAAVRKNAQSALDELDQLVDADGSLKTHTSDAVGKSRIIPDLLDKIGGGSFTPSATKGREGLKSLKAKLVLDVIGQMKAQSRTGATGFGALNLKELAVLEAAASKLENRDLSDEDFKAELGRIKDRLKLIIEDSPEGSGGSNDADKRAEDYMRRKGLM